MSFARALKRQNIKHKGKEKGQKGRVFSKKGWQPEHNEEIIKQKGLAGSETQRHVPTGKGHHMARSMKGHT